MNVLEISDHWLSPEGPTDGAQIRELKLARPPVNALNSALLREIVLALAAAKDAAAIVFSGQPGVFSAGLDVRAMLSLDREAVAGVFVDLWRAARALAHAPMPVIFALTGHSPAGGTVLAIHGDYRVMAQGDFRLGLNEVQVGLIPGPVLTGAFRRLTGGHAAQLLTRGALVDPVTALRVGLVDELCEPAQVTQRALAMAREFCAVPRAPMLRARELARRDLMDLFGNPGHALIREREFGAMAAELWFVPATQERLQKTFNKAR